jgi:hypothetical protein
MIVLIVVLLTIPFFSAFVFISKYARELKDDNESIYNQIIK